MNANTAPASPSVASTAPQTSTPPLDASPRLSGTLTAQTISSTTPMGALTRKAQAQE